MSTDSLAGRLAGICHIMITPFTEDQAVDHDGLAAVVHAAKVAGASAVVPLAIMGEAHKLLDSERRSVLNTVVEVADGELAVVAGISSDSTYVAAARAREAEEAGVDYVMMAPPRNAAAGADLVKHYEEVARASSLPLVVQDEPVSTGVRMPPEFFAALAAIEGVAAVKVEEAPSPQKISAIRGVVPNLACFGGLGGISFFEELGRGADGIMTGFGYPRVLVDIYRAYTTGDHDKARQLFYHYLPIIRFEAQLGVGGVAIRKRLFFERGIIATATVRSPTSPVDEQTNVELRELIDVLGLRE